MADINQADLQAALDKVQQVMPGEITLSQYERDALAAHLSALDQKRVEKIKSLQDQCSAYEDDIADLEGKADSLQARLDDALQGRIRDERDRKKAEEAGRVERPYRLRNGKEGVAAIWQE